MKVRRGNTRRRKQSRRSKKRFLSRRRRQSRQRGGADLPVPKGSVVGVDLDPKDAYSVPVLLSKNVYEEDILED
jgi:hypothetical protein